MLDVKAGPAITVAAAAASAAEVSLRLPADGEEIPLLGFAQATVVAAAVGVVIAAVVRRRASRPASTFTAIAVELTVASLVPPVIVGADAAIAVMLIVAHVLAAAVVIPAIACQLAR